MELLSVAAVAELLGVGTRAVRKAIAEKRLHATRIGKGWRIRRVDLDQMMAPPSAAVE